MNKILTHDFGKSFPPAMSFTGYIFAFAGLIASTNAPILGGFFVIIGILIGFARSGIQINVPDKTYRSYNSLFGLKQGRWKSLKKYKFITLLRNQIGTAAHSASNRRAVTSSNLFYEVTLLSTSHRNKRSIKREPNKEKALESLKELSNILELPIAKYDPHRPLSTKKQ